MKRITILLLGALTCLSVACREKEASDSKPTHSEIMGAPALDKGSDQLQQTEFTAYLDFPITSGKNLIWCATMQLAWNELIDKCGEIPKGGPRIVQELNRGIVTKSDLDDSSYVAVVGETAEGVVRRTQRELETKFHEQASPELLNEDLPKGLVAYSYLFKDLSFLNHLLRFNSPMEFLGFQALAFGFSAARNAEEQQAAAQVTVYDYRNSDDFVVEIKTRSSGDRLILAKVHPDSTLHQTIAQVAHRLLTKGMPPQTEMRMEIPLIDFRLLKDYDELVGLRTCGANPIVLAQQMIRFKLDEKGAKLKSEAVADIASADVEDHSPPQLIFDKPFLVIMERQGLPHPYFALWVDNPELLVPFVTEKTEQ